MNYIELTLTYVIKTMKTAMILILALALTGCTRNRMEENGNSKATWIEDAFASIQSGKYPRIKAIAWWHEDFSNTFLRIDSSPESLKAYKNEVRSSNFITAPTFVNKKLIPPAKGIYHAANPDFGGTEDIVTTDRINDFESLIDKEIVWAYFSNNWYDSVHFPTTAVKIISATGKVPYIRLMPRSRIYRGGPDTTYTMQRIIDGYFDAELTQWAIDAAETGIPLLAEFGTEVNGNWFPWNGEYNGGGITTDYGDADIPDGPERFRDAYRHIIDICYENGTSNITWFFHVDANSNPKTDWNSIEYYYPGDDYIDWFGVSVYGQQEQNETRKEFSKLMDGIYPSLTRLSDKPIAVLEFGITEIK